MPDSDFRPIKVTTSYQIVLFDAKNTPVKIIASDLLHLSDTFYAIRHHARENKHLFPATHYYSVEFVTNTEYKHEIVKTIEVISEQELSTF